MSSTSHYSDLFEFAPYAYVVTDEGGHIIEANRESAELLNRPAGELAGGSLESFIPMEQGSVFRGNLGAIAGGCVEKRCWRGAIQRARGRRIDIEFTVGGLRRGTTTFLYWMLRPAAQTG